VHCVSVVGRRKVGFSNTEQAVDCRRHIFEEGFRPLWNPDGWAQDLRYNEVFSVGYMEAIVPENNGNELDDRSVQTTQIQIQVSGASGETQMVTLPLSMASAITASNPPSALTNQHLQSVIGQVSDDPAKRRELLSRRPSYRKILNELSGQPDVHRVKDEPSGGSKSSESSESDGGGGSVTSMQPPLSSIYQTGVTVQQPPNTLQQQQMNHNEQQQQQQQQQNVTNLASTSVAGLQTFSMANALAQGQATLVPGDASGNTLWMPGNHVVVHGSDSQMYQIRTPTSSTNIPVVMGSNSLQTPQQMAEEASRKRELRLMKNREAAKECRRRKKEYVKCLETRVAVLENQNKQLIDELKTLKELYVHKQVD